MLIFVHKLLHMPSTVPFYVKQTISPNIPIPGVPSDSYYDWYTQYNSIPLNMRTTFFKGPLLYYQTVSDNLKLNYFFNHNNVLSIYKGAVQRYLMEVQSTPDPNEWHNENHKLVAPVGLRQSQRLKDKSTSTRASKT